MDTGPPACFSACPLQCCCAERLRRWEGTAGPSWLVRLHEQTNNGRMGVGESATGQLHAACRPKAGQTGRTAALPSTCRQCIVQCPNTRKHRHTSALTPARAACVNLQGACHACTHHTACTACDSTTHECSPEAGAARIAEHGLVRRATAPLRALAAHTTAGRGGGHSALWCLAVTAEVESLERGAPQNNGWELKQLQEGADSAVGLAGGQ